MKAENYKVPGKFLLLMGSWIVFSWLSAKLCISVTETMTGLPVEAGYSTTVYLVSLIGSGVMTLVAASLVNLGWD